MKFSVIEIYNDTISDLLYDPETASNGVSMHSQKIQQPQIKELSTHGNGPCLVVQNVLERSFETYEEGLAVVRQALSRRQVHETTKNIESSRSHAIFVIKLYSRDREGSSELE